VVYAASRIHLPPIGCTVPQPRAKQAAFDATLDGVDQVVTVANWLAVSAPGVLLAGIVAARSRIVLLALILPLSLSAIAVNDYGHDLRTAVWVCADA
jgi:hypothetical protein